MPAQLTPPQAKRRKPKRLAARLLEAMEEIKADARGIPSGVVRFTLSPSATPAEALDVMEAAIAEAEEKERAHLAGKVQEQIRAVRQMTDAGPRDLAACFGVSVATVKAWDAGTKVPTGAHKLLLEAMVAQPRYWKKRLRLALAEAAE